MITMENYPKICAAFRLIEEDNGGHLIGTVYPGEPINLYRFEVPSSHEHLVETAEIALSRLSEGHSFVDFCIGEESEVRKIMLRQGDLEDAQVLLNSYFDKFLA